MRYFCDPVPIYQTRGVADDVDPFIITKCIELLERLKESISEPDYLQVYTLAYEPVTNALLIKHTQEVPEYSKEVSFILPAGVKPYEGKLYFIDDVTHRTFLKPEEY